MLSLPDFRLQFTSGVFARVKQIDRISESLMVIKGVISPVISPLHHSLEVTFLEHDKECTRSVLIRVLEKLITELPTPGKYVCNTIWVIKSYGRLKSAAW